MTVNYHLVLANDNFNHYRKWAEAKLKKAYEVIESQRHEIQLLNKAGGRTDYVSELNSHISTGSQKQVN